MAVSMAVSTATGRPGVADGAASRVEVPVGVPELEGPRPAVDDEPVGPAPEPGGSGMLLLEWLRNAV